MYENLDWEALNEWLLVKQIQEDLSQVGGIIIPDQYQGVCNKGIVVSKGDKVECKVEVGDLFAFSEYSFMPIKLDDEDFILVRGTDSFLRKKTKPNVRVGKNRKTVLSEAVSTESH